MRNFTIAILCLCIMLSMNVVAGNKSSHMQMGKYRTVHKVNVKSGKYVKVSANRLIINVKSGVSKKKVKKLVQQVTCMKSVKNKRRVLRKLRRENSYLVYLPEGLDLDDVVSEFECKNEVKSIEYDHVIEMQSKANDKLFNDQWYLGMMRIPGAWDRQIGKSNIMIGFLDTGVDTCHPDLVENIEQGYDAIRDTIGQTDDNGHGTMCAGVISANHSNNIGIAGIASGCRLLPVKVLDENGQGYISDVVEGIYYVVDRGVRIINMSFGCNVDALALRDAINYAVQNNCVMVAPAGNRPYGSPIYPAGYEGVIAVSAIDNELRYIAGNNYGDFVDVCAPGTGVLSTQLGGQYDYITGSSVSAASVCGVIALALSEEPSTSNEAIERYLHHSSIVLGNVEDSIFYGNGLVDAQGLLSHCLNEVYSDVCVNGFQVSMINPKVGQEMELSTAIKNVGSIPINNLVGKFILNRSSLINEVNIASLDVGEVYSLDHQWNASGFVGDTNSISFEVHKGEDALYSKEIDFMLHDEESNLELFEMSEISILTPYLDIINNVDETVKSDTLVYSVVLENTGNVDVSDLIVESKFYKNYYRWESLDNELGYLVRRDTVSLVIGEKKEMKFNQLVSDTLDIRWLFVEAKLPMFDSSEVIGANLEIELSGNDVRASYDYKEHQYACDKAIDLFGIGTDLEVFLGERGVFNELAGQRVGVSIKDGATLEDNWDQIYTNYANPSMYFHHFWINSDSEYDGVTKRNGGLRNETVNAFFKSRSYWNTYIKSLIVEAGSYSNLTLDKKKKVYEYLGRICHLLQDCGVPAHIHDDLHIGTFFDGDDCYEDWMAKGNFYLSGLDQLKVLTPPVYNYDAERNYLYSDFPNLCNMNHFPGLHYLFYNLTQTTDRFASDGCNGNATINAAFYEDYNNKITDGAGAQIVGNDDFHGFQNISYSNYPASPLLKTHLTDFDKVRNGLFEDRYKSNDRAYTLTVGLIPHSSNDDDNDHDGDLSNIRDIAYKRVIEATAGLYYLFYRTFLPPKEPIGFAASINRVTDQVTISWQNNELNDISEFTLYEKVFDGDWEVLATFDHNDSRHQQAVISHVVPYAGLYSDYKLEYKGYNSASYSQTGYVYCTLNEIQVPGDFNSLASAINFVNDSERDGTTIFVNKGGYAGLAGNVYTLDYNTRIVFEDDSEPRLDGAIQFSSSPEYIDGEIVMNPLRMYDIFVNHGIVISKDDNDKIRRIDGGNLYSDNTAKNDLIRDAVSAATGNKIEVYPIMLSGGGFGQYYCCRDESDLIISNSVVVEFKPNTNILLGNGRFTVKDQSKVIVRGEDRNRVKFNCKEYSSNVANRDLPIEIKSSLGSEFYYCDFTKFNNDVITIEPYEANNIFHEVEFVNCMGGINIHESQRIATGVTSFNGCRFENIGSHGNAIDFDADLYGAALLIRECLFKDNRLASLDFVDGVVHCENNSFISTSNDGNPISHIIVESSGGHIRGCTFVGQGIVSEDCAIQIDDNSSIAVHNNKFKQLALGIDLSVVGVSYIYHNLFLNNEVAVKCRGMAVAYDMPVIFNNNIVKDPNGMDVLTNMECTGLQLTHTIDYNVVTYSSGLYGNNISYNVDKHLDNSSLGFGFETNGYLFAKNNLYPYTRDLGTNLYLELSILSDEYYALNEASELDQKMMNKGITNYFLNDIPAFDRVYGYDGPTDIGYTRVNRPNLYVGSPVDIIIVDPDLLVLSNSTNTVGDSAFYIVSHENGEKESYLGLNEVKSGVYQIKVVRDDDATDGSIYTLRLLLNGRTYTFAEDEVVPAISETTIYKVEFDDIAPAQPKYFAGVRSNDKCVLSWIPNSENDISHYYIYGNTFLGNGDFENLIATVDRGIMSYEVFNSSLEYFKIVASDYSNNSSICSEPIYLPNSAVVVDDFEGIEDWSETWGYNIGIPPSGQVALNEEGSIGLIGSCMSVQYDFVSETLPENIRITKSFEAKTSLSNLNTLGFWLYGDSLSAGLQLVLGNDNGAYIWHANGSNGTIIDWSGWKRFDIPLNEFDAGWPQAPVEGWNAIEWIKIIFRDDSYGACGLDVNISSYIYFDDMQVYYKPEYIVLDSFDNVDGWANVFTDSANLSYEVSSTLAMVGNNCMKIDYAFTDDVNAENNKFKNDFANPLVLSGYEKLGFWLYGDSMSAGMQVSVGNASGTYTWKVTASNGTIIDFNGWQKFEISLNDFQTGHPNAPVDGWDNIEWVQISLRDGSYGGCGSTQNFSSTIYLDGLCVYSGTYPFEIMSNPDMPSDFSAGLFDREVELVWCNDIMSDALIVGFEVYRSSELGGSYDLIGKVDFRECRYYDDDVACGGIYYYKIRTIDSNDAKSEFTEPESVVMPILVEDFNVVNDWFVGSGVNSHVSDVSLVVNGSNSIVGDHCGMMNYTFDDLGLEDRVSLTKDFAIGLELSAFNNLGFWVYGDSIGAGCQIKLGNSTGYWIWKNTGSCGVVLDYTGWRQYNIPFDEFQAGHPDSPADGWGNIEWVSISLRDNAYGGMGVDSSASSAILVDDIIISNGPIYMSKPVDQKWEQDSADDVFINPQVSIQFSPNPFAYATNVRVKLNNTTKAMKPLVSIYNSVGNLVKKELMQNCNGLYVDYEWNGTNDLGYKCAAGLYYIQVTCNGRIEGSGQILLLE